MRNCDGCTACCTVMAVKDKLTVTVGKKESEAEFFKPWNQRCEHQTEKGCAIYGKHPHSCAVFSCLWAHSDKIPEEDRPDKNGLLIWRPETPVFTKTTGLKVVAAAEVFPGAFETPRVRGILEAYLRETLLVLVRTETDRRMMGPDWQVIVAKKYLADGGDVFA